MNNDGNINNFNQNILNMIIFNKLKTGNPIIDAFIATIIVTYITYCLQLLYNYDKKKYLQLFSFNIYDFFYKKNIVEYEGKVSSTTNKYDCQIYQTSAFSHSFKALWNHIIDNINSNSSIYHIQEYNFNNIGSNKKNDDTIYIVSQIEKFIISEEKHIYAHTCLSSEKQDDDERKQKNITKETKINIKLFSYQSNQRHHCLLLFCKLF